VIRTKPILVIGATGCIGCRLVPLLLFFGCLLKRLGVYAIFSEECLEAEVLAGLALISVFEGQYPFTI